MPHYQADNPTPEAIAAMPGKVILEFGTDWCGHCQAAQSVVNQALAGEPNVKHLRVEDSKGRRLGRVYGVKPIYFRPCRTLRFNKITGNNPTNTSAKLGSAASANRSSRAN
jgi:thiol-disulfide isomerase/thioredoxin